MLGLLGCRGKPKDECNDEILDEEEKVCVNTFFGVEFVIKLLLSIAVLQQVQLGHAQCYARAHFSNTFCRLVHSSCDGWSIEGNL